MPHARRLRATPAAAAALLCALAAASEPAQPPELAPIFLSQSEVTPAWEIVREGAEDVSRDPDLVRAGVRERSALHYTRARGARSEVCSVELWSFADAQRAERAERMLPRDAARVERIGPLLVSLRAVTLVRQRGSSHALFPDCAALGEQIQARARRALGAAGR